MSKLLVVFAATGQQGGSLIDYVLKDNELSTQYKIRAISRNTEGEGARALKAKGVEVVQADLEQPETLKAALNGAHTVFSNTATVLDANMYSREVESGKAIADASVAAGAQFLIYSSSTPGGRTTGRAVPVFDCKYEVEEYIKTLPIKSAFYVAGTFMQNWLTQAKPRPTENPGEYAWFNIIDPSVQLPLIEIVADTGKFVGAMLADPEKYAGTNFYAASEMLTGPQITQTIAQATGKDVKYVCLPEEKFKSFLPPQAQEMVCAMYAYMNNPGYYGAETKERVASTQALARGKLTTFAEFLKSNPIDLD